jgi:hypothetical protein
MKKDDGFSVDPTSKNNNSSFFGMSSVETDV